MFDFLCNIRRRIWLDNFFTQGETIRKLLKQNVKYLIANSDNRGNKEALLPAVCKYIKKHEK